MEISKRINLFWVISFPLRGGANPAALLLIYKSIIHSKIKYGCIFSGSYSEINLQKLQLFVTYTSELPFVHSIPLPSLSPCRDLNPPFSYRIEKLSMQFLFKATAFLHFLVYLPTTILSALVFCIQLTILSHCNCSTRSTI